MEEEWVPMNANQILNGLEGSYDPKEVAEKIVRHTVERGQFVAGARWRKNHRDVRALVGESLRTHLKHGNFEVRKNAVYALGIMGYKEALEDVVEALKDPEEEIRQESIWVIDDLGYWNRRLASIITRMLDDESEDVVKTALSMLSEKRERSAFNRVEELLDHPDREVRTGAFQYFESIGDPRGKALLLRALEREEDTMRRNCVTSLLSLDFFGTLPLLILEYARAEENTKRGYDGAKRKIQERVGNLSRIERTRLLWILHALELLSSCCLFHRWEEIKYGHADSARLIVYAYHSREKYRDALAGLFGEKNIVVENAMKMNAEESACFEELFFSSQNIFFISAAYSRLRENEKASFLGRVYRELESARNLDSYEMRGAILRLALVACSDQIGKGEEEDFLRRIEGYLSVGDNLQRAAEELGRALKNRFDLASIVANIAAHAREKPAGIERRRILTLSRQDARARMQKVA